MKTAVWSWTIVTVCFLGAEKTFAKIRRRSSVVHTWCELFDPQDKVTWAPVSKMPWPWHRSISSDLTTTARHLPILYPFFWYLLPSLEMVLQFAVSQRQSMKNKGSLKGEWMKRSFEHQTYLLREYGLAIIWRHCTHSCVECTLKRPSPEFKSISASLMRTASLQITSGASKIPDYPGFS